uniref:Uncharacterized protein n=1 Tax=Kalanchoe fedtschenkoi TaxID=63787 RepID=A0A7N0REG6_KALFE
MASTAIIRCPSIQLPPFRPRPRNSNLQKLEASFFPPLKSSIIRLKVRAPSSSSTPRFSPTTEDEVLKAISDSDESVLPCVRTYENDLGRLSLVGAVDFQQALTAAAADGGEAAAEHMNSGISAMVVETVYPGTSGERSTISTRLFLPTRNVLEKARNLRGSITEEMVSATGSKNILAMTFKQVVLHQVWSFELALFNPGCERDMNELDNPREAEAACTLSSSDEKVISAIAEVICKFVLDNTERSFVENSFGKSVNGFLPWFWKPKRIISRDNAAIMYKLNDYAISQNAKKLLEMFNSTKEEYKPVGRKLNFFWAKSPVYAELERIGGLEFSSWVSEYIPAYKLEIDADELGEVKFEGWKSSEGNRWEILLTHSQLIEMANVLDMYYEDVYTLPDKELPSDVMTNLMNLPKPKRNFSFFKTLSVSIASGILLFTIGVLGRLYLPHFYNEKRIIGSDRLPPATSEADYTRNESVDQKKLEGLCISVVEKIKDSCSLPEEIKVESGVGAWIGEVPQYLNSADTRSDEISTVDSNKEKNDADASSPSVEDIASYQVVLTLDGKIVGFQPTSRVAVNHWAANPLAKELHGGRNLSPGILEPGLSIPFPNEVVVIELLMSVNPKAPFALARPVL